MSKYWIAALSLLFFPHNSQAFHVVIDAGHGGSDRGAVHNGIAESDLVLTVAQHLKTFLHQDKSFQVTMTRHEDKTLPLPDRVRLAEQVKADLFVSLHANAALDKRARGIEFFFQNALPPDEESLFLANQENQLLESQSEIYEISGGAELSKKGDVAAILEDLKRQARMHSSLEFSQTLSQQWSHSKGISIKQGPFYVISRTSMPAVLVELGFLTNPIEVKKLKNSHYQRDLAQKIYTALASYKESLDKPSIKTLD